MGHCAWLTFEVIEKTDQVTSHRALFANIDAWGWGGSCLATSPTIDAYMGSLLSMPWLPS